MHRQIFNEWFKPQRAEAMIGAKLFIEGPVSTFLGLVRPYSRGDFEEDDIKLFALLVPHLQRAVQLQMHWRVWTRRRQVRPGS